MNDGYWAAAPENKIGGKVLDQFADFKKYLLDSGIIKKLRKSYSAYYGNINIKDLDQSLKAIHVNNYAALVNSLHVMVTSSRPAWSARAINSDLKSQGNAELAEGLLDYYMKEQGIENHLNKATELAMFLMEGWIDVDWDTDAGEEIHPGMPAQESSDGGEGTPEEKPIKAGDVIVRTFPLIDVCRDIYRKDMQHKWFITRDYVNKWDMSAKYPDFSEQIEKLDGFNIKDVEYELTPMQDLLLLNSSDLIPMYTLKHDKTPALPNGRFSVVFDKDCVVYDGPLHTKRPYCFPIYAKHKSETAFGHSSLMDLLPLQDALDANFSAILTNQSANAVQNFQMPEGSGLKVTQIQDGMNVIEFDPKKGGITPLDLLKTAPEVFNFNETLNRYMQLISGVSSVVRGDAPSGMSGTAMALLQQQSIQFSSGMQLSHTIASENCGTAIIELLQTFAEEPRMALIAGKTKKPLMKDFSNKDLMGVGRVIVDSANPLTKTGAGRMEIANQLLQTPGMIKTPEQYLGVLLTGNLEPLYEFDRSRQHLVKAENEAMMNGQLVKAVLTDDHPIHVLEHSCVLNSIEARNEPNILQAVLTHIQEHMDIASQMTPQMAAMLKQTSFAAPPPQPPPQSGPGPNIEPSMMAPPGQSEGGVPLPKPAQSPVPNLQ